MQLTRFTDYSIRVLIFLAAKNGERATINEVSETFSISRNHVMKIVQSLSQKGYIVATRGKNGGLTLACPPSNISVGCLVRDTEEMSLVECFRKDNACVITPACRLKPILHEALDAFLSVLDRYTLADLMENRTSRLALLLNIPTTAP
ncbi:Rrf2 family transcriptional regulator [Halomonas sp. BLK-85]